MSTQQHLDDHIIARYTAQPARLQPELRRQIESAWQGAPVQLYALADLDQSLRLTETWVALGPHHLAVARRAGEEWEIRSVERRLIQAVREAPGLSANTLTILGTPDEPALALVRYTHRQRRAFENIRFVLEEQLEGSAREIPGMDADRVYAESIARPVREAQALGSGRQTAVIRRLLGYLKPYRRQLTLGMTAATVITLVSLIPPYLAGTLIDRVVRPAQAGTLPLSRAITIAWLAVTAMAAVYLVKQAAAYVRLRLMAILGEWVARAVGHDPGDSGGQGVQPGAARDRTLRRTQRGCDGRVQPDPRLVDDVLAAARAGRSRHDDHGLGVCGAPAVGEWGASARGNVRFVPPLYDDVSGADRRDRADGPHDQPRDDIGTPGVRGAGHRAGSARRRRAGSAGAGARPRDVRPRGVWLRRRSSGVARCELRCGARRADWPGGPVRWWKDDDREPDRALLRRDRWRDSDRRRRHPPARYGTLPPADRHGAAGPVSVPWNGAREYPLWIARGAARAGHRGGAGGERSRLHHQAAARLRHGGGGAGAHAVRRGAPARVDCAGDPAQPADSHSRRGDEQRRYGDRAGDSAGAGAFGGRAHRVRDRAPAVDAPQVVPVVRDRGGAARRAWDACRALAAGRGEVSTVVRTTASARVTTKEEVMTTSLIRHPNDGATQKPTSSLRLEWRADGSLWALQGGEERAVSVRRCFPWSEPSRHLSLRDADEEEFALVRDPAELDARSRAALEMALAVVGFVFEVTRVLEIDEEVEIRRWRVETRQGPRTFQTRLDDWPRILPHGGLLIRDLAGDLYHLGRPESLDRKSQELLWPFVD